MMTSPLLLVVVTAALVLYDVGSCSSDDAEYHDYIIVGAGPGGLQSGFFLDRAGLDYIILERDSMAGSFFSIYPRHDQLISINKRHTGKTNVEFNLRHDWNSLLSTTDGEIGDQLARFGTYSKLMFPSRQVLVRYLNDFARNASLHVRYDTDVGNIRSLTGSVPTRDTMTSSSDGAQQMGAEGDGPQASRRLMFPRFAMTDQRGKVYQCHTLIVATGLWQPNTPPIVGEENIEGYESISVDPDDYEGQSVLILGRGNSAFELARSLYGSTNLIHMIGRSRVRLSWATHYVGDLRAVNNELLDTYQLKSLDAILEAPIEMMAVRRQPNGKLSLEVRNATTGSDVMDDAISDSSASPRFVMHDNFAVREPYDRIIRCLGFRFNDSLFSRPLSRPKGLASKYPKIDYGFESVDHPGVYFVGTATHSLDLRKSAGGFIHGFRYTARALHRLLQWTNHGVQWPTSSGSVTNLVTTIVKRINEASGIYQMYKVLGDVILLRGKTYEYIEEFPFNLLHELPQRSGVNLNETSSPERPPVDGFLVISLEYGINFSRPEQDVFRLDRATGDPWHAHQSNFLHPVFYYYRELPTESDMMKRSRQHWPVLPRPDRLHHVVEDFLTTWDTPLSHVLPLRRFVESCVDAGRGLDLRSYFADTCMTYALTHSTVPPSCDEYFRRGHVGLERPPLPLSSSSSSPQMFADSETKSELSEEPAGSSSTLSSVNLSTTASKQATGCGDAAKGGAAASSMSFGSSGRGH